MIRRNPCRIKGAGQEESAERPTLTIAEVYALADAIDPQYRVLVLLGTFASLRWAELAALRRCDIDTASGEISVSRQLIEQLGGGHAFGPPKSRAGKRVVPFPALLNTEVAQHLSQFVGEEDGDLRHTGNTLTADAGANLRELMERMGHSSTRAALVYLHSTSDRQRSIADAVGNVAKAALARADNPETSKDGGTPSGTKVARRRGLASSNRPVIRENTT